MKNVVCKLLPKQPMIGLLLSLAILVELAVAVKAGPSRIYFSYGNEGLWRNINIVDGTCYWDRDPDTCSDSSQTGNPNTDCVWQPASHHYSGTSVWNPNGGGCGNGPTWLDPNSMGGHAATVAR
ncbi:MAG: hypothetical protein NTX57_20895 [Armatimonadetes bacterium]|jgi:hypothetical protein|nr:hypothetical protein [Armatimonadota bacterium]